MESLELGAFNQVDEVTSPEKLPPQSLTWLTNAVLDNPIGAVTKRHGYSRYSQADTSGTVNNLFDVKDVNDNNYFLANIGTKLRKFISGTWSDIKTSLTSAKMRMAAFGENFFFTNDNEAPFYTDLTNTYDMEIDRPIITGVSFTNNDVGVTSDYGLIYYISYITSDGQESNVSLPIYIAFGSGSATKDITLNDLPVSSDSRVVSKKIYRSESKDFTNFYLLEIIDNDTTTYNDVVADDKLDTTEAIEYKNTPQKSKFITTNNDRFFLSNVVKKATNRVLPPYFVPLLSTHLRDDTQSGNLSAGTYKWARSFIDQDDNESELVVAVGTTVASGKQVSFFTGHDIIIDYSAALSQDWIFNVSIKTIRYYRTKANGSTFYHIVDLNASEIRGENYTALTYYEDNTPDASLTNQYPLSSNNSDEELNLKTTILFSNINKPLEFPELNLWQIYPDDSDEITGVFDDDNGIVVFKTNSICKLYTNGDPTNWDRTRLITEVGCDEPGSIVKYENSYFFIYRKKVYVFNGGAIKQISYRRKTTFDSVTEVLGASFYSKFLWYVLTVKIGSDYYLMCYDTKLDCWYKFQITKADTLFEKKFGADKGELLIGGDSGYITKYDTTKYVDSETGSNADVSVQLITKYFAFPDTLVIARLMFMFINYLRQQNTTTNQIVFSITDPISGAVNTFVDQDDTVTKNVFKTSTDGMNGYLERCTQLNFAIYGEAFKTFYQGRIDYNVEQWGLRRKATTVAEGHGMSSGMKAGTNAN